MSSLYTVDSKTVDESEFKDKITDAGYYTITPEKRTWLHIGGNRQIIMAKELPGKDGKNHTFRIAIDT